MKKAYITQILLLAALLTNTACGTAAGGTQNTDGVTSDTEAAITETQPIVYDVTGKDYGGITFTVINYDNYTTNQWSGIPNDIDVEESNGDTLNDSVYKRNSTVEEKLNIKIESVDMDGPKMKNAVTQSVMAGAYDYDAMFPCLNQLPTMVSGEILADLSSIDGLDFEYPWWDVASIEKMTISGKTYGAISDITYFDKLSAYVIFYNQKLAEQYQFGDMYELIDKDEWTYDKLLALSANISRDLNSDGIYDPSDSYGLSCQNDGAYIFLNSALEEICAVNEKGVIEFTLKRQSAIDALQKIYELMNNESLYFNRQKFNMNVNDAIQMFIEDRTVFLIRPIQTLFALRNMEAEFGILPIPKFSKTQERYGTAVNPYAATVLCLPAVMEDEERTATILQALACESHYTVTAPFYELILGSKLVRDERSTAMLNLVFSERIYDLGLIWNFGKVTDTVIKKYAEPVASNIASVENQVQSDIDNLMELVSK